MCRQAGYRRRYPALLLSADDHDITEGGSVPGFPACVYTERKQALNLPDLQFRNELSCKFNKIKC